MSERRPYHRTADSIWSEPWPNDVLAFVCRLSALLHERWRTNRIEDPDRACEVTVTSTDLMKLAGKGRLDVALTSASRAAHVASISVERHGNVTLIRWPKWAYFQGLNSQTGPETVSEWVPPNPRPASSVQRPKKREESQPPAAALALAGWMYESLRSTYPSIRPPNLKAWARDLDLLCRVDGRDERDVRACIEWLVGPNLKAAASFVVQSPKALRQKWDRIAAVRGRSNGRYLEPVSEAEMDRLRAEGIERTRRGGI